MPPICSDNELNLKVNDRQPAYYAAVLDSDNVGVDLTGATIYCTMKNRDTGVIKINRQSAGITLADQTLLPGYFQYNWQSGDTDTVGEYNIEFEINPQSGGKFTMPSEDTATEAIIKINSSLDNE